MDPKYVCVYMQITFYSLFVSMVFYHIDLHHFIGGQNLFYPIKQDSRCVCILYLSCPLSYIIPDNY